MQIGIFSDCHCGFKYREERGEDSFIALNEAINKTLDCDLILIAGDLFDSRIPKPEVFARTARILSKAQHIPSRTKFVEIINKDKHEISPLALRGIPIIAIHGTHERRSRYLINPLQALEQTGLLIHLHHSTAIFEIDDKKIAIHGMSGVPERYAKDSLLKWNPRPIENAVNVMMIHQSITPYVYSPLEPPSLKIEDLPKGFDLYVLGHMHWHDIQDLYNGKLLLCGSTTPTSIHKIEAEQPKYIYKFDNEIKKFPLETQRKVIWQEFTFVPDIRSNVENMLSTIPITKPRPIVNIKIKGVISKDSVPPSFVDIEEKYKNRAIISINKDFEMEGFKERVEMLRMLREEKLSPEEHGLKILQENLKQVKCGIKIEEIFEHLIEGNTDLIFNLLTGKQKSLRDINDNKS